MWTKYALSLIKTERQEFYKGVYDRWIVKKKQAVIDEKRDESDDYIEDHHICARGYSGKLGD